MNKTLWDLVIFATVVAGLAASRAQGQTGACCSLPGPFDPNECIVTDAINCAGLGGTYQGDFTECTGPFGGCNIVQFQAGVGGAPNGGQVNFAGATLFVDFFSILGSTNDFSNIDGDTVSRPPPCSDVVPLAGFLDTNCDGSADAVDQLAPNYSGACSPWTGYALVQYRSVGSVEGFTEFVDNQLLGDIPRVIPSERGIINHINFASLGAQVATCDPIADFDGDGNVSDESGTPVIPHSIDGANLDVPTNWAVEGPGASADARWDRKPRQTGYGRNPKVSTSGFSNLLATVQRGPLALNFNNNPPLTPPPDADTLFDTPIAWSPVVPIANRGTGLQDIRFTEMQHLWVTGRMPTGENFEVNTRDVGSGTRNDFSNGIGVDPSHLVGDHRGPRVNTEFEVRTGVVIRPNTSPGAPAPDPNLAIGSRTQPTNCGGSGITEGAVRSRRLCVGYTGYFGSSRAAQDAVAGEYEILNVCRDIDGDGDGLPDSDCTPAVCNGAPAVQPAPQPGLPGCGAGPAFDPSLVPDEYAPDNSGFVRPMVSTILDNDNPRCGYTVAAAQTLTTRGDPQSGIGGNTHPAMANVLARNLIRNITDSIASVNLNPPGDINQNMPGQVLVSSFILAASPDAATFQNNPTNLQPFASFSQSVQDFVRCRNGARTPAFGTINVAGQIPRRNTRSPGGNGAGPGGTYSDGSSNGNYVNQTRTGFTAIAGQKLNRRNRLAGDFNNDGFRDLNDVAKLMEAIKNPAAFQASEGVSVGTGGGDGPCADDYVIPEIIGDFDADGDFNSRDVRYFADGLAMRPGIGGSLDRKAGFESVDLAWNGLGMGNNYFATTLATPTSYKPGDSRADIAGNPTNPGGPPEGSNGIVNATDIDYVYANRGVWSNLRYDAANMDLSADLNGDLVVNQLDVDTVVLNILCTRYGDANLDGKVDGVDQAIVSGNQGLSPAGWADGDFNGDKIVNAADSAIMASNLGFNGPSCTAPVCGDIDGNGLVNLADQSLFVDVLLGLNSTPAFVQRANLSPSFAATNGEDVQRFVCCLLNSGSLSSCP